MQKGKAMKYIIVLALVLVVTTQNSYAQLNELIKRNVKKSTDSYELLLKSTEKTRETPRLWIHVRSSTQEKTIQDAGVWLKSISLGGRTIEVRPIQILNTGPSESQLRFFRIQDKKEAEQLLHELKKALPQLQLKDFSRQYQGIDWLKPGHYELWLTPAVNSFSIP